MMSDSITINLRRLRKLRTLTQQQIADLAGISRVAYRNIETGESVPRSGTLTALAGALKVPVFDIVTEVPELKSLRFRSLKSLSARERAEREQIAFDVGVWLNDFNDLEALLDDTEPYQLGDFDFSGASPEVAAAAARENLDVDCRCCVVDVCDLMEHAGIKVRLQPSLMRAFFGLSVGCDDGGPAISVNTDESIPVERRIFTAAHELGHLLLHTGSYGLDQLEEDKVQEAEANEFAAHFLMPQESFALVWSENRGHHWVDSVLHTKRRFKVSYKTVLRRLVDMGQADRSIYRRFVSAYDDRYGKRLKFTEEPALPATNAEEPSRLDGADFMEDRLSRLVRTALERDLISVNRAAEILGLSLMDMRKLILEWEIFG